MVRRLNNKYSIEFEIAIITRKHNGYANHFYHLVLRFRSIDSYTIAI